MNKPDLVHEGAQIYLDHSLTAKQRKEKLNAIERTMTVNDWIIWQTLVSFEVTREKREGKYE